MIQGLEVFESSYTTALELLTKRYSKETLSALRYFHDTSIKHIRELQTLDEVVQHWDFLVIHLLVQKLNLNSRKEWEHKSKAFKSMPSLANFHEFLLEKCIILSNISLNASNSAESKFKSNIPQKQLSYVALVNKNSPICKKEHPVYACTTFKSFSVDQRIKEVQRLKLCKNCLRTGHSVQQCNFTHCKRCQIKHNMLLHAESGKTTNTSNNDAPNEQRILSHATVRKCFQTILSTVLLNVEDHCGKHFTCKSLLDSGSQVNLITESLPKMLSLPLRRQDATVVGINQ